MAKGVGGVNGVCGSVGREKTHSLESWDQTQQKGFLVTKDEVKQKNPIKKRGGKLER